mgnify:CR=1 FL=1
MPTPVFMPVGTKGTVKGLHPDRVRELGASIVLANTYHLHLRPGEALVEELGGLHRFTGWDGPILTDSGGFQVFSLSGLRTISEEGVLFQSHLNGDRHLFTPASTVDTQLAFGSDIMMVLDECVGYPAKPKEVMAANRRTVEWARAAFRHYRENRGERVPTNTLFPIVQGGMDAGLRRECAEQLMELDAEGYAIGGLSENDFICAALVDAIPTG